MAFDITTAREEGSRFDISTAKDESSQKAFIPKSEGFLKRALNIGQGAVQSMAQAAMPSQNPNPFFRGIESTMKAAEPGAMRMANAAQEGIIDASTQNPFARFGLKMIHPYTLAGGEQGAKVGAKAVKSSEKYVSPLLRGLHGESALKLSERMENVIERKGAMASKKFGRAMEDVQAAKPNVRISFLDELTRPQLDPRVTKLVSRTERLKLHDVDNLTLKESQEIINDLKANLRQSLKTGDVVKSDERGILSFIGELKSKQRSAFPEIDEINKAYGTTKEAVDELSGSIPGLMEGQGNRIQRAAKVKLSRNISPIFERILGRERRVRNVAKALPFVGGGLEALRRLSNK